MAIPGSTSQLLITAATIMEFTTSNRVPPEALSLAARIFPAMAPTLCQAIFKPGVPLKLIWLSVLASLWPCDSFDQDASHGRNF
jgi:hypothetical protein